MLHDLLGLSLLLNSSSEPEYELTQILLLRCKHLEHTVTSLFVLAKEGSDTLFVGLSCHIWIEVTHNLLTLAYCIYTSKEKCEE